MEDFSRVLCKIICHVRAKVKTNCIHAVLFCSLSCVLPLPMLPSAVLYSWISLPLSFILCLCHSASLVLCVSIPPSILLAPSPCLSPPLCPWGPSPFILTPRAITISVVTAGHVTCTCSSGWSPHAGAIWPHTHAHKRAHTLLHLAAFSLLFLLASSWPHISFPVTSSPP